MGEHYYNVGFAYMQARRIGRRPSDFLNLALRKENPQPKMYRAMATALRELGRDELAEEYERQGRAAPSRRQAAGG